MKLRIRACLREMQYHVQYSGQAITHLHRIMPEGKMSDDKVADRSPRRLKATGVQDLAGYIAPHLLAS